MQTTDSGSVTSEASARRQSSAARAMMLTIGRTICPAPSGIMCASGGSRFSILSTIMLLISPMVWLSTSPSGACRNRSARRRRSLSRMVYAMLCDMPVERVKVRIFAAYAASADRHHRVMPPAVTASAVNRQISRYMQ